VKLTDIMVELFPDKQQDLKNSLKKTRMFHFSPKEGQNE
jgi:hypothetical protein